MVVSIGQVPSFALVTSLQIPLPLHCWKHPPETILIPPPLYLQMQLKRFAYGPLLPTMVVLYSSLAPMPPEAATLPQRPLLTPCLASMPLSVLHQPLHAPSFTLQLYNQTPQSKRITSLNLPNPLN